METMRASKRRSFCDYVLEPIHKRRRTDAADPLEFNDPETIRDFLIEQNLPIYPDIIYLSDTDTDEDQDTVFLSCEDSIRPQFFADELGSVKEEADLRGYSSDRSSGFLTESESMWPFRVFRPVQCFSDFSDVSDASAYDGEGEDSSDNASVTSPSVRCISDERPEEEEEEIVEGEGDNFVMVDAIMP